MPLLSRRGRFPRGLSEDAMGADVRAHEGVHRVKRDKFVTTSWLWVDAQHRVDHVQVDTARRSHA